MLRKPKFSDHEQKKLVSHYIDKDLEVLHVCEFVEIPNTYILVNARDMTQRLVL